MSLLIKNAKVLTMENSNIFTADLLIKGDLIKKISKDINEKADEVIDASGMLLMPGFINCHTHIGMSLFRNYGKEVDLHTWLNEYIWPIEEKLVSEDVYISSLLSISEMLKNGITSFADMYFLTEASIRAIEELKIRGQLSIGLTWPDKEYVSLNKNVELFKNYKNHELISIALGPHAIYTNDTDYLRKISDQALKYNIPIHIHLSETKKENDDCIKKYGMTPTEVFEKTGILDNKTIAAHGVFLTDNDLDILKAKEVSIAHNPVSNLKLKSGFLDLSRLIDNNINVCLGTDSSASNNKLSVLREMQVTALVSNLYSSRQVSAFEILKMATVNGAKALGLDNQIGLVKEGMLADLVLIDIENINHIPENNILTSLVYSTYESDIKYTIIGGEIVNHNGEIKNIDMDKLLKDAKKSSQRLGM